MAVLKADAYHLGMAEIASRIHSCVDAYAVAYIEEGVSLRKIRRLAPILIFIYRRDDILTAAMHDLTLTISSVSELLECEKILKDTQYILSVEFAINTGMNRYGFCNINEFNEAIDLLNRCTHIKLRGVYSHLYDAEIAHNSVQCGIFDEYLHSIPNIECESHLVATNGIINDMNRYDTVRVGLGMYVGLGEELHDAVTLYSRVQSIRRVKSGEFIGYSCNYRAKCDIMIAVVFGGYADGLDRRLSGLLVDIEGGRGRIIGNICMDVFFVDITGIDGARVGSKVTIVGGTNTITSAAQHAGITEHELLTSIHGRVERSYI